MRGATIHEKLRRGTAVERRAIERELGFVSTPKLTLERYRRRLQASYFSHATEAQLASRICQRRTGAT